MSSEADWIEIKSDPGMPPKLSAWRQKLSDKAKQGKMFRFYSLYSLVCHPETLKWAWTLVRRNNGAKEGKNEVYDADLSGYFDSIPHDKLMACVKRRIVDGSVLYLIRQGLTAPVLEPPEKGKPPKMKRNDKGTPQGGVISPLTANLYLHWFEKVLLRKIDRDRLGAGIVR